MGRIEGLPVEEFADDLRRALAAIEDGADLIFDQRPLFLDDDDEVEAGGEVAHDDGVERPDHADLEQAQAQRLAGLNEAEIAERLQEVLPGLARRDDPDAGVLAAAQDAVQPVGAGEGERGGKLVMVEPLFLRQRQVDRPGADAAGRVARAIGNDDRRRIGADIDGAAALGDVGHHLHADPAAGKARHGDAEKAEVDQFLGVRRIEDGHADGDERGVGEIDRGRGSRAVIVAGQRQRPALRRSAGEIGVTEGVAGPVDARTLAVPDAEDAIDRRPGEARQMLRAPDRGRRQILVEAGTEDDIAPLEDVAGAPELDVEAPHRRAAVAGDIAAGVEAGRFVAQALLDRQTHQRLHPGHVEPAFGGEPAVFQRCLRTGKRGGHANVLLGRRPCTLQLAHPLMILEIAGNSLVEFGKVSPNDVDVERREDRFLRLPVEEKAHRRRDAGGRIGAELCEARRVALGDGDAMAAFPRSVAHAHGEGRRASGIGADGDDWRGADVRHWAFDAQRFRAFSSTAGPHQGQCAPPPPRFGRPPPFRSAKQMPMRRTAAGLGATVHTSMEPDDLPPRRNRGGERLLGCIIKLNSCMGVESPNEQSKWDLTMQQGQREVVRHRC